MAVIDYYTSNIRVKELALLANIIRHEFDKLTPSSDKITLLFHIIKQFLDKYYHNSWTRQHAILTKKTFFKQDNTEFEHNIWHGSLTKCDGV
jgi:hypothetical protein